MSYNQNIIDGLKLLNKLEVILNTTISDIYTQAREKSYDDNLLNVEIFKIWKKAIDSDNEIASMKMHIDHIRSVLIKMRPSEEMSIDGKTI